MKAVAAVSFLTAAVVVAADSIIPNGISGACSSTLQNLDSNSKLQSCLSPIIAATNNLTATSSSSTINTALTSLCSSATTSACPDSMFRDLLTQVYADCKNDFDESTGVVKSIYDVLYGTPVTRESLCTKDTSSGGFCVQTLAASAGAASSLVSNAQALLGSTTPTTFPIASGFGDDNIAFQFLTPNSPQSVLCSPCAIAVMQPFVTFGTAQPYGPGVATSEILKGQNVLWSAMSHCADSSSIIANAGAAPSQAPIAAGALNAATNTKVSAGALGAVALLSAALVAF